MASGEAYRNLLTSLNSRKIPCYCIAFMNKLFFFDGEFGSGLLLWPGEPKRTFPLLRPWRKALRANSGVSSILMTHLSDTLGFKSR